MEIETIQMDAFTVCGIVERTSNALESNPQSAKIPSLWQRFFSESTDEKISTVSQPDVLYGVYHDYDDGTKGEYTVLAGVAIDAAAVQNPDVSILHIPANRYLVFRNQGNVPQVMYETWRAVWDYFAQTSNELREFKIDFERFDKNNSSQLEIFVSIK